jgi:hypothetical protein
MIGRQSITVIISLSFKPICSIVTLSLKGSNLDAFFKKIKWVPITEVGKSKHWQNLIVASLKVLFSPILIEIFEPTLA